MKNKKVSHVIMNSTFKKSFESSFKKFKKYSKEFKNCKGTIKTNIIEI